MEEIADMQLFQHHLIVLSNNVFKINLETMQKQMLPYLNVAGRIQVVGEQLLIVSNGRVLILNSEFEVICYQDIEILGISGEHAVQRKQLVEIEV